MRLKDGLEDEIDVVQRSALFVETCATRMSGALSGPLALEQWDEAFCDSMIIANRNRLLFVALHGAVHDLFGWVGGSRGVVVGGGWAAVVLADFFTQCVHHMSALCQSTRTSLRSAIFSWSTARIIHSLALGS